MNGYSGMPMINNPMIPNNMTPQQIAMMGQGQRKSVVDQLFNPSATGGTSISDLKKKEPIIFTCFLQYPGSLIACCTDWRRCHLRQ